MLEVSSAKPDENLIAPDPDSVIRRPAAETAFFLVHRHMTNGRRLLQRAKRGKKEQHRRNTASKHEPHPPEPPAAFSPHPSSRTRKPPPVEALPQAGKQSKQAQYPRQ